MAHADLSRIFVDRPILAAVLSIVIFVAGLIAIPNLPITEYPEVSPPTVQVTAIYPGANPKTIADTVAAPLEEAINGVENMIYMKSAASSDGTLSLSITFKLGTDIDLAAMQVQNRVNQALPRLPESVRQLGVTTAKASPNITMVVHIVSPDGRYDGLYLSNFATLNVKDELARLDGVGQAQAFGAGNYAMRIWIDPDQAAQRGLTALDIVGAIREQNVQVSAGAIGASPQPAGASIQLLVNARGRLESAEEFGDIVLKTGDNGAITRLRDVARVELGSNTYALNSYLNNQQAAAVVIFEAPGANSIALSDAVRARMAELAKTFPEGIAWEVAYDPTVFVRKSIDSVIMTLLEAIALVVVVVVVFLQTWRASIIPLLAVPVSIVGTFAVLLLLGYSINVLTLFGLVLAIGIVVDDAIVVVENVERHIEEGMKPLDAAHKAMQEVSGPIVAISLVLAAVFVPIAFIDGVTGQFYRQFAVTIAVSVLISAFNSLTLSPALSAVLLKPQGAKKDRLARLIDRVLGRFFNWFNAKFKRSSERYSGRIGGTIARAPRLLVIYGLLLVATVFGFLQVPAGFIPTQDKQYLFAGVQLPEGATLERTEAAMKRMGEIALATPGVADVVQFPGLNAIHFVSTPNVGVMFVGLDEPHLLPKPAAAIAGELTAKFGGIQDGMAFAFMPPPVFGYGNAAGVEAYVQDRQRMGYGELNQQTQAFAGAISQLPGFGPGSAFSSFQANVPQIDAVVDRSKVKESGLRLTDVFDTLQVYLGSAYVNDFNLFGRTFSVYAQADAGFRDEVGDVARLQVRNDQGQMVPLGSVVEMVPSFGPDPVVRYNGYPAADVTATPFSTDVSAAAAVQMARATADQVLPRGMTMEFTGLTYQQVNQGIAQFLVLPLCVLLVYLVLAALYESWSLPLAVILIVPMCMLSAFGGIWVLNMINGLWFGAQIGLGWINPMTAAPPTIIDMNVFTQIGLVVLMGLACKNAILIVEFARDLEEQGRGIVDAAVEACRLRLRPILMTSFAFCAGVLPLVFASGAGAEVRHVMGVTVFFGMLGVTFFGLFFTPVFYVVIRKLVERRRARLAAAEEAPAHA
ncbi:multidrug efflux RND transporter permease subunit [uncultured Aquimonas sp.]|uniref:efflux RND transporter permease subunit n=1 Tax=uncultured Aquimonas sp. TaxID=385483 RepID=UPI000869E593|nr:multidrug efflux RND transporter permease subunit [uncultured Aquimonas sp.]ODU45162.1 MAG: multidrug efflux RND transporter permease subunit [Xanthomonadaceae bacterium SCN 69-123]